MKASREIATLASVLGVVLALPLNSSGESGKLATLRARLGEIISGRPGIYSVAFRDFTANEAVLLNAGDRTHAASLMKLPVMMAAFELAGRGELDLGEPIPVHENFESIIAAEPFVVRVEPASPLFAHVGGAMPLRELIDAMITRSDNTATNLVIERIGAGRVNDLARRLGTRNTKILRGVEDNLAYEAGISNETSAEDMLTLLAACRESPLFTDAGRAEMLAILQRQQHRSMIGRGIPEGAGAVIANKTGSISWVEHDAGIVQLPNGRPYGIVIMTRGFADKREQAIQTGVAVSAAVYDYVSSL